MTNNTITNNKHNVRTKINLQLSFVQKFYHLPSKEAAKKIGISESVLTKIIRNLGIIRWPYRKVNALRKYKK